jgi:molybdopterin-guanine dinucleotide biosynthesis protein A
VHHVFGLWPLSLARDLEDALKRGLRKVGDWVRQHNAEELYFPALWSGDRKIDPFFNINRPEDLAEAEAFLQGNLT